MIAQPEVRCVEFVDEITEWLDGALTDDELALIEEHLSICPHCTRYLDQMRAAIVAVRHLSRELVPAAMHGALLTALRNRR